ncbi:16115_t:CDS:1 [Cetraspora pellucida]|uniref:16115_t:CDS:1 n=1 Tax=Cetraspora pellucida TaxID=1433469 RepID=A0A9N9GQB7_9GLOM|nr:16115_t:CDS:1 [Cetraspora pellucida]
MTDTPALTRCNLFIANFVLTLLLTITLPFSLHISFSRWNNKKINTTIQTSAVNQQQQQMSPSQRSPSYVMQEGVFKDGQPVLVFHSNGDKRNSRRMSLYHQRSNSNGSTPNLLKDSESTKSAKSVEAHVTGENGNIKHVAN